MPQSPLHSIDHRRFKELGQIASQLVAASSWSEEMLADLSLDQEALIAAVERGSRAGDDASVFDAFEGAWVGGDLHDVRRAFFHLWHPTARDGKRWVQRVEMFSGAGEAPCLATNIYAPDDAWPLHGVVDGRPYVAFTIAGGGLLWVGEETQGNVSIHAEAVRDAGRLYEVRGEVWQLGEGDALLPVARSDWRYHRVPVAALQRTIDNV